MNRESVPQKQKAKAPSTGQRFMLFVILVYVGVLFVVPDRAIHAFQLSLGMLGKLLPILAFVFVLMFFSNLLIQPQWVKKHVGQDSGLKGYLVAVVGGIFSMGPIYLWFEFLRDLQGKGMRTGLIATFLYARSVKPQLLPLMVLYFGWTYALVLEFYLFVFAILHGWLMQSVPTRADQTDTCRSR